MTSPPQTPWQPYGWPAPAPAAPPPGARPPRAGLRAAIAVGVTLALVAAAGAGLALGRSLGPASTTSGATTAGTLDTELPRLIAFVEDARGLEFRTVPAVQVLDDAEYEALLAEPGGGEAPAATADAEAPHDYALTYEALRLTDSAEDFTAAEEWGWTGGSLGFYDPATDDLVVRGTAWTHEAELTVVHELTHALQDQHFDLGALDQAVGPTDDDAWLALSGLVEGDAVRIEGAYVEAQNQRWYDEWLAEDSPGYGSDAPYDPLADAFGSLPYDVGYDSVSALYDEGGNSAVDEAFASPPTTTEQLYDLVGWLGGDADLGPAEAAPAPAAGSDALVDQAALGVAGLGMLASVDRDFAGAPVLDGWRGDTYVTWVEDSGRACTRVTVVFDGAADAKRAGQALEAWVDLPQTEAEQSGATLLLASCGDPG